MFSRHGHFKSFEYIKTVIDVTSLKPILGQERIINNILEIYKKQLLRTAQEQYQQSTKLYSFDDMTEGDLVFFKSGRRHIGHVGVYLGNHFFVHASTSGGVMISSLHESYWNRRFAGGGRP